MSDTQINSEQVKRPRLKFIDMARSIAILLMLEGHFIDMTLNEYYRDPSNAVYSMWHFIRGFTAPMFFTVTGVVFVYLLSTNNESGFFKNRRVKKGFRRALELLFWGYALQLSLKNYDSYLQGNFGDWVIAFHVLQCIGAGIAVLLFIYGLWKLLKVGPLFIYYFIFATVLFSFYPYLKHLPDGQYFPENGPQVIQNMFKGPNSVFPIIPWLAFTIYGGMVGALLFRFHKYVRKIWFPLTFIALGIVLNVFGYSIFKSVDAFFKYANIHSDLKFVSNAWLYGRLGQVLFVLAILMLIERFFTIKDSLFLKIGQNTLPIYVIHVIILYSGIFGYGLNMFLKDTLSPWQAILGAIGFILIFALFIYFFDPIIKIWTDFKARTWGRIGKLFRRD